MLPAGINSNDPLLKNLQANILKGHGRNFARHLFLQINKGMEQQAKNWISKMAETRLTNAQVQLEGTRRYNQGSIIDAGTIYTLSLSAKA